jgi:hypothetical protein
MSERTAAVTDGWPATIFTVLKKNAHAIVTVLMLRTAASPSMGRNT